VFAETDLKYGCVCRPNDGFLRQLEMYQSMGYRVDLSFPAYRKYRLDMLAQQMQKGISFIVRRFWL